jgi:hypothetical protein
MKHLMLATAVVLLSAVSGYGNWNKTYKLDGHRTQYLVHMERRGDKVTGTYKVGLYPDLAKEFPGAKPPILLHFSANVEDLYSGGKTLIKDIQFTEDVSKERFWVSDKGLTWVIISMPGGETLWITYLTPKDASAEEHAMGPTYQLKLALVKQ